MTKEELKNKCTERAKIFQQAMESCKSSNPIDCIEWFADRIAELEKENAKLKSEKGCETCTKFDKVQLTKAKEIIRQLLLLPYANNEEVYADVTSILDKAEQFLKQE